VKAAIFHGPREIRREDIAPPSLTPDAVIVRVEAAAICNATDNRIYRGTTPETVWPFMKPPYVLGHEACGTIVAKGASVDGHWRIGDRITGWGMTHGAFAQYARLVPSEMGALLRLDSRIDSATGAMMELAAGATRMLLDEQGRWRIKQGNRVVVFGLGPSGLLYLQAARCLGAAEIVAVGKHNFRMDFARGMGFAHVDVYEDGACVERIQAKHGPADVVIDTTGADIVPQLTDLFKIAGYFVLFGVPSYDVDERMGPLNAKGVRLAQDAGKCQKAIEAVQEWLLNGSMDIKALITMSVDLEHVGDGLDACVRPKRDVVKVLVEIPQESDSE
jgi:2-desacetyl-2-hydroxyethyl bacteriochlorophyllide A dehydrogenase